MKDIKTFVIGFLTCACLFLIMGQTNGELKSKVEWLEKELKNHKKDLVDVRKLVTDQLNPLASTEAGLKTVENIGDNNYGRFAPVGYFDGSPGETLVYAMDTQTGQLYSNIFNMSFGSWKKSGKKIN